MAEYKIRTDGYIIKREDSEHYCYLREDNRFTLINDINLAYKFGNLEKAKNVLQKSKCLGNGSFSVIYKQNGKDDILLCSISVKNAPKTIKITDDKKDVETMAKSKKALYNPKTCSEIDFDNIEKTFNEASTKICEFAKFIEELHGLEENLSIALSKVDLERCDMEHAIELGKFNACEGYKMMAQMQEILRRRRIIKDALYIMPYINGIHDSIKAPVEHLETRTYNLRVLKELSIRKDESYGWHATED